MLPAVYIIFIVVLVCALLLGVVLVARRRGNSSKTLAGHVLAATDKAEYSSLCDRYFRSKGDPVLYEQYTQMRDKVEPNSKKSEADRAYEVANLCRTAAKAELGVK